MRTSEPEDAVAEIVPLLQKLLYVPEAGLTAQTRLETLGLDSLDLIEAGLELEAIVGRDLPDAALVEARTVGDLARLLAEAAAPAA